MSFDERWKVVQGKKKTRTSTSWKWNRYQSPKLESRMCNNTNRNFYETDEKLYGIFLLRRWTMTMKSISPTHQIVYEYNISIKRR